MPCHFRRQICLTMTRNIQSIRSHLASLIFQTAAFGTQRSQVQILSPRLLKYNTSNNLHQADLVRYGLGRLGPLSGLLNCNFHCRLLFLSRDEFRFRPRD